MGHPQETRAALASVRTCSHLGSEERASSVQKSLVHEALTFFKNSSSSVSLALGSCESFQSEEIRSPQASKSSTISSVNTTQPTEKWLSWGCKPL